MTSNSVIFATAVITAFSLASCSGGEVGSHTVIQSYEKGVLCDDPARVNTGNFRRLLRANRDIPVKKIVIQSEPIQASPWRVYQALTNAATFQAFSRVPATAKSRSDSLFLNEYALFGGALKALTFHVHARPEKIELYQLWNGSSPLPDSHPTHAKKLSMPKNFFILTKFTITETRAGTIVTVTQSGVPTYSVGHISTGWKRFYLGPMKAYFEKS